MPERQAAYAEKEINAIAKPNCYRFVTGSACRNTAVVFSNNSPAKNFIECDTPLTGERVEFRKVYDPKTGKFSSESSGPMRTMREFDSLRNVKAQQEYQHYGKAGHSIRKFVDNPELLPDTGARVVIHLKYPFYKQRDPSRYTEKEMIAYAQEVIARKPMVAIEDLQKKYGIGNAEIKRSSEGQFEMKINRGRLEQMRTEEGITAIEEYSELKPTSLDDHAPLDYRLIAWSAFNPAPLPPGCRGEGVNIATSEDGISENCVQCLGVDPSRVFFSDDIHSTLTFATMVYSAPGANHYHTSRDLFAPYKKRGQSYRLVYDIKAMSQSTEYSSDLLEQGNVIMDESINLPPYTLFCNPSANINPSTESHCVHWGCYNHLSVGSSIHVNLNRFEPAGHTITRNPPVRYGWANSVGASDREMPHILTPGARPISANGGWYDDCVGSLSSDGTSFSAPVATGIVADIISASKHGYRNYNFTNFNSRPDLIKAVLMLTSQDCDGLPYQGDNFDGKDGTGTVSASEAVRFAMQSQRQSPGTVNCLSTGYYIESWEKDSTTPIKIPILTPDHVEGNRKLRIVLTWNSVTNADTTPCINEISDLDLYWINFGHSYSSRAWDNNVEFLEIPWSDLLPNKICTLTVNPHQLRFPQGVKQDFFNFSVVWDWVIPSAYETTELSEPPVLEPYINQTPKPPRLIYPPDWGSWIWTLNYYDSLIWAYGSFAERYKLQIRNGNSIIFDSTFEKFNSIARGIPLSMGSEYFWRIGTITGNETIWSNESHFVTLNLQFPFLYDTSLNKAPTIVDLIWQRIPQAESYSVQCRRGSLLIYNKLDVSSSESSVRLPVLDFDSKYSWRVGINQNSRTTWNAEQEFQTKDLYTSAG